MEFDELDPEALESGRRPGAGGEQEPKKAVSAAELLATTCSRVVLGLLLFVGFIVGFWVGGVALHDPDTCWLLALGRWIVEHHQIPATDPFSWSFAAEEASGQRFILYQWLSEVVFYLFTLPAGLVTLLMLCAVTISTAFLSIPMSFVVRREAPFVQSAWVVFLGIAAASFHTLARPEIFSYLLLALYLQQLHDARVTTLSGEKKIFPLVAVLAPLMVLWGNMHTGFISGFAVIGGTVLGSALALIFMKAPVKNLLISSGIALAGCFFACMVNPYGPGIYAYIPKLFNLPINKYIIELQPVISPAGVPFDLWPFLLLCVVYLSLLAREGIAFVSKKGPGDGGEAPVFDRKLLAAELIISFVTGQIGIFNGLQHRRVACFVALILVAEIIALLSLGKRRRAAASDKVRFWPLLDAHSLDLWKAGGIFEMAIVALCAVAGVALVSFRIAKPELPASSTVFLAPFKAIKFIEQNQPVGKVYNDQQFGDMLIYYLPGKPKVFIDTRFDMYGSRLVEEYRDIHECLPGWREKFDKLGVDWVFLIPGAPLTEELQKDPAWVKTFSDNSAIILQRKN